MGKYIAPRKATDARETPDDFFARLDAEFHFTFDAAASPENAKCQRFLTPKEDGLSVAWTGEVVWLNPPYSQLGRWMIKAHQEWQAGATVVCLVPAATDTQWWHTVTLDAEIRFIKGRIRFKGTKGNAPFPSALVIFRAR